MNSETLFPDSPTSIVTASGRRLDLMYPASQDVRIVDVAHHLACVARFAGALADERGDPVIYTVAQHSVIVASLVSWWIEVELPFSDDVVCRNLLRKALFHDSAEAFLGDMTSPLKQALRFCSCAKESPYDVLERRMQEAVELEVGIELDTEVESLGIIKRADTIAYMAEVAKLRPGLQLPGPGVEASAAVLPVLAPREAKQLFLAAWVCMETGQYAHQCGFGELVIMGRYADAIASVRGLDSHIGALARGAE